MTNQNLIDDFLKNLEGVSDTTKREYASKLRQTKGTDIKGPVAAEASEKWPRVANLASMVV